MQNSILIQNGTGAEVRTQINNALQTIATDFAGGLDPATMNPNNAYPFCTWLDTGNNLLKRRNANNTLWIDIGTIDSNGKVLLFGVYGQRGTVTITADTTLTNDHSNKLLVVNTSSNVTLTMPQEPTPYMTFKVFNKGEGTVTLAYGTFYGATGSTTNIALSQNQSVELHSDGVAFYSI